MTWRRVLLRNLVHYRRMNACIALGAALATAVLVGALATGDAVRGSLRNAMRERLGLVRFALAVPDRPIRTELADALGDTVPGIVAPVFEVSGSVDLLPVEVRGIDARFWAVGGMQGPPDLPGPDEAVINRRLAEQLGVGVGSTILLRVARGSLLPREFSFSRGEGSTLGLRVKVTHILDGAQFGDFSLKQGTTPVYNVFVSRVWVAGELGLSGLAHVLLAGGAGSEGLTQQALARGLRDAWRVEDVSLAFRALPGGRGEELTSARVFIDRYAADAALRLESGARPVLTYFVNSIRSGAHAVPYSFVSAPGAPVAPSGLGPREIVLNTWTANELEIQAGDTVDLEYYVPGPLRRLVEHTNRFVVARIVPLSGEAADPTLVPDLPGLSDAGSCTEWDPGIPIDLKRIRPADEAYWDEYRGTPKAFVSFETATNLWGNRYGACTAIRFASTNRTSLAARLRDGMDPEKLGLSFANVGQFGVQASGGSVDFGQLFLSLSFFLLGAALLLTGLLFGFGIQSRGAEIGTLLALGWPPRLVRRLLLAEGVLVGLAGTGVGVLAGIGYQRVVLAALGTIWQGAVAAARIDPHVEPRTLLTGWGCGLLVSVLVMRFTLRRLTARRLSELALTPDRRGRRRVLLILGGSAGLAALGILLGGDAERGQQAAGIFFVGGTLLLFSALMLCGALLDAVGRSGVARSLGKWRFMVRGCMRRWGRTMASVALLAGGIFVVVAVGANRHPSAANPAQRGSGTGGFAFFLQSAVPLVNDLGTRRGREAAGLPDDLPESVQFVPLRLLEGDEASCLNLNRVIRPQVLGVDPEALSRRGAFSFATLGADVDPADPWRALSEEIDGHTIPAIADQTVITWSLNQSVGDMLSYRGENGEVLRLKLVAGLENSILQGYVVVSEKNLLKHYPALTGCRVFLVDAPSDGRGQVEQTLRAVFRKDGMLVQSAGERLAAFNVVQDTYLGIFLILGGLGVVLGTAGVGVVLLRNVLERRWELSILRAVGFTRREILRSVLGEHLLILAGGVLCGVPSALMAVLPSIATAGRSIPWIQLDIVVGLVIVTAFFWIALAAGLALRGNVIEALREE